MDIKKFEKAQKAYLKIKELDKQIIEIENLAMQIANGENSVSFEFKLTDLTPKEEKVKFDEDCSIFHFAMPDFMASRVFPVFGGGKPENDQIKKYNTDISVNASLQILGVLLHEKQSSRTFLINQLNEIGVSI